MAKKRSQIIKETLEATLSYFPDELKSHRFHADIARRIETFFLTDHCIEADENTLNSSSSSLGKFTDALKHPGDVFKHPKRYSSLSEDEKSNKKHNKKPSIGFKLENPLDSVGNTVEKAVGTVGAFLKQKLSGEEEEKQNKDRGVNLPPPIDTSASSGIQSLKSPVVPYTRKTRRSSTRRLHDEDELNEVGEEANLLLDDDRPPTELVPSYSHPVPNFRSRGTKAGDLLENNPLIFALITIASILFLKFACKLTVSMDLDILLLLIWAAFCIGLHTPRPMIGGVDKSTAPPVPPTPINRRELLTKNDRHGRRLLRMSMRMSTPDAQTSSTRSAALFDSIRIEEEEDEIMEVNQSPLPMFPEDAKLGSKLNCWSEPESTRFHVRGPKYLADKVKIPSGAFVFPVRGVDLFLTDACPENAGR